jgi:hypothetical protein
MGGTFLSPAFVIGQIRIGSVEGASCINLGNNLPSGFKSRKMQNQGFGSVGGDGNTVRDARSFLYDQPEREAADRPPAEEEMPDWIREIIHAALGQEQQAEEAQSRDKK